MTVFAGARVVTHLGVLDPGWVTVDGSTITGVGKGKPPTDDSDVQDLGGAWLVPGFVDIHCHGGAGVAFGQGRDATLAAAAFHRQHGTTRMLASLVTAPIGELVEQVRDLADFIAAGTRVDHHLTGIHLEGPFISPQHRGAHAAELLRRPDPAATAALLDAGRGWVKMVTLAPELPGGMQLLKQVIHGGAVAAVGHTDATYAQARDAFAAGASVLTHSCNGMRGLHHREPGPVLAAADTPEVYAEIINDGIHLHDATSRMLARSAGERLVLVTDAMAAAGVGDGDYMLGTLAVRVVDGVARLADSGTIAGSTLTMDMAFRRAVVEVGLPIEVAAHAASTAPARAIGLGDRVGRIAAEYDADFVVLDDDLRVFAVVARGAWSAEGN